LDAREVAEFGSRIYVSREKGGEPREGEEKGWAPENKKKGRQREENRFGRAPGRNVPTGKKVESSRKVVVGNSLGGRQEIASGIREGGGRLAQSKSEWPKERKLWASAPWRKPTWRRIH